MTAFPPLTAADLTPAQTAHRDLCAECEQAHELNQWGYCTHCQALHTRWLLERRAKRDERRAHAPLGQRIEATFVSVLCLLTGGLGLAVQPWGR